MQTKYCERFWLLLFALVISGCQKNVPTGPEGQVMLQWKAKVFSLLTMDMTGDGNKEIIAIDHGQNVARIFNQSASRQFEAGYDYGGVGMHPGNMLQWPREKNMIVLGAEGDGAIRSLMIEKNGKGFRVQSNLQERAPRYLSNFNWPDWGDSLAVAPYANGVVVLLKGYDPYKGLASERFVVTLAEEKGPTIRSAERIAVADLNGDGVEELLFAVSYTKELMQISLTRVQTGSQLPKASVLYRNPNWGAPNQVYPIDLDDDGDQDLLLADETSPGNINVLLNDGAGNFTEHKPIPFPYKGGITELRANRDGDGSVKLLAVGYGAVALYQVPKGWPGGAELQMRVLEWPKGGISLDMVFDDIDGDGWLDGAVGKVGSDQAVWVVYGPLWERFKALADQGFKLN